MKKINKILNYVLILSLIIFSLIIKNKVRDIEKKDKFKIVKIDNSNPNYYIKYTKYFNGVEEIIDSMKGKNIVYRYLNIDNKEDVDIMVSTVGTTYKNRVVFIITKESNASEWILGFDYATEVLSDMRDRPISNFEKVKKSKIMNKVFRLSIFLFIVVLILFLLYINKIKK